MSRAIFQHYYHELSTKVIFIFFSCTLLVFNSLAIGDLRKAMELVEEQQASAVGREIQAVQVQLS